MRITGSSSRVAQEEGSARWGLTWGAVHPYGGGFLFVYLGA